MKAPYEEYQLDESLKKLNYDILWRKSQKQILKSRILDDIEGKEYAISPTKIQNSKKKRVFRRIGYAAISTLVLIGLFIGSTFISPAMAEVAAKIPYLNKIFQLKPVHEVIWESLETKGYKIDGLHGGAKEISIYLRGSEKYYQESKGPVKELVEKIVASRGYDAYSIKVLRASNLEKKLPQISERDQAIEDAMIQVEKEIKKLKIKYLSYGYYHGYMHPSPNSKNITVELDIPNTEKREALIKKTVNQIFEARNIQSYSIKINQINLAQREKESQWDKIFQTIDEGLTAKKEYKVTGYAYSFHPAPLQIIIKTSIKNNDPDAVERAGKIEKTVQEFLHSKEIKTKIEGQPYKIIVISKEKKQINN